MDHLALEVEEVLQNLKLYVRGHTQMLWRLLELSRRPITRLQQIVGKFIFCGFPKIEIWMQFSFLG